MLSNNAIRSISIAVSVAVIGIAYNLRPEPARDPLAERLAVCGDTPPPYTVFGSSRFETSTENYNTMVKSVDACRVGVIDQYRSTNP